MTNDNVSPTKSDQPLITRDIIALYDRFTHGDMDRRSFMNQLGSLAGSSAAALAILPMLSNPCRDHQVG